MEEGRECIKEEDGVVERAKRVHPGPGSWAGLRGAGLGKRLNEALMSAKNEDNTSK